MSVTFNVPLYFATSSETVRTDGTNPGYDSCLWTSPLCGATGPTGAAGATGVNGQIGYTGSFTPIAYASATSFTGSVPLYTSYSPSRADMCTTNDPHCGDPKLYPALSTLLGYLSSVEFNNSVQLFAAYSNKNNEVCTFTAADCANPALYGPGGTGGTGANFSVGFGSLSIQTIGPTGPSPIPVVPAKKSWWQKYWWIVVLIGGVLLLLIIIIIIIAATRKK